MERGIYHGKCQDCEQRFSHATEKGRLQCDIIGEMLARNDSENLYQCSRPTCRKWDILFKIKRSLCHKPCTRCRSWNFKFKEDRGKVCYPPVSGRNNPYIVRKPLPIVDSVPNHPNPYRRTGMSENTTSCNGLGTICCRISRTG
jgi:hypothetical protein